MALTKISRSLLNTGVSDSSDATAITIDSSENVGIGVTTPFSQTQITETGWSSGAPYGTVLTVTGNNTNDANWGHLLITDSSTGTGNGGMLRFAVGSTSSDISPHSGIDGFTEGSNYGGLKFLTRPNGGTSTERMRIDSEGNVGIGITNPSDYYSEQLVVNAEEGEGGITIKNATNNNGYLMFADGTSGSEAYRGYIMYGHSTDEMRFYASDNMNFYSNGSERMRIDSSGRFLFGTTDSSISSGPGFKLYPSATYPQYGMVVNTSNGTSSNFHLYNTNASFNGFRWYINTNGGTINYSANNVNLSDERLKTNIEISGNYLEKICNIPVKLFNYKDEPEDKDRSLGVIAQEVEAVAPELVNNDGFGETPEDGVPLKTVYTTDMMYALMKAIQELSAKVEELESKINE